MSKANDLAAKFGANLAQTVGMRAAAPMAPAPAAAPGPDKYAGAARSRAFAELPVDAIERDEAQPRTEFDPDDLARLAASIKRFGQLAPIRVRHDPDRGRWVVLVGERRLRACKLAGIDRIRVEFVERPMSEADILAEQTVENVARAELQPVEQGRAYRRLMDLNGWSVDELADTLGVKPTSVYRAVGLLRLPEDVAERVDSGEIRATAAYEISQLPDADQQREVAERVVAEGLDHKATAAEVTRRRAAAKGRGARARAPKRPTSRTLRTSGGCKVTVEHRKGVDPGLIRAALAEALAVVEAEAEAEAESEVGAGPECGSAEAA